MTNYGSDPRIDPWDARSTDSTLTDLPGPQKKLRSAVVLGLGRVAGWVAITAVTIFLWTAYFDRVFVPEMAVMALASFSILAALEFFLRTRNAKSKPAISFLVIGLMLGTFVFSPSAQRRFSQSSMLSAIRQAGGSVNTRSSVAEARNTIEATVVARQFLPLILARCLGGDDFFGTVIHVALPANLLNERNLKRWNFNGIGVTLAQEQHGEGVPSLQEFQMFLDGSPGLVDSYVSNWDAQAVMMALDANSGVTFTGRVARDPLSALYKSSRPARIMFLNVQAVDLACLDLIEFTSRPQRYVVIRSCAMTPEFMKMVGKLGPISMLEVSTLPESEAFESFCRELVVSRMEWTIPMSRLHAEALGRISTPFELMAPIDDESLQGLAESEAFAVNILNENSAAKLSPITDASLAAVMAMRRLGALTIPVSSLTKQAILQLTKKSTLRQLQVRSDNLSGDDIQEIRAAAPRSLRLTVMR